MPINSRLWFTLEGTTSLLMHSPASMQVAEPQQLGRKVIPTAQAEAAASRYLLPDGNFYVKAIAVRNCLLSGAKGYRVTGTRRSAIAVLSAAIGMGDETFPLLDGDGNVTPGDRYTVDTQRVNLKGVGSVLRSRARIALPWKLICNFPFNSDLIATPLVQNVLVNAGEMVGLLDYRPEKKGWFGKFTVEKIWVGDL